MAFTTHATKASTEMGKAIKAGNAAMAALGKARDEADDDELVDESSQLDQVLDVIEDFQDVLDGLAARQADVDRIIEEADE